jgi:soluble lytic murein transglycosylase-like protein
VQGDKRYKLVLKLPRSVAARTPIAPGKKLSKSVEKARAEAYLPIIARVAEEHKLDDALIQAVIHAESGFNPSAVSDKGAIGLMQLMPATAKRYGIVDPFDPLQNIRGGTKYLKDLWQMFDQDLELVLAAYNAGENAVIRHGRRIPPYGETLDYVPKVMRHYYALRKATM